MDYDLTSAKASLVRMKIFRNECVKLMPTIRETADRQTYDLISRAYDCTGNASRELRILIEEMEKLSDVK